MGEQLINWYDCLDIKIVTLAPNFVPGAKMPTVRRFIAPLTLVGLVVGLAPLQPTLAQSSSPNAIFHPGLEYPLWVSAAAAENADFADTRTFHPLAAERIRNVLSSTPVQGCQQAGPIILEFDGGRNPPRSYQEAARSYPVFAYGIVRELTPGFLIGEAGHLVRIEVSQPSRGFSSNQQAFVFLPMGEFSFRGKKVCKRDPRYAGLPAVGDELLVFAAKPLAEKDPLLHIDYPEAVVLVSGNVIRLAPPLAEALASRSGAMTNPQSRDELLALLPVLQALPVEEEQR